MKQTRTQIASTPVADPWWDVHSSKFLLAALVDFHPEAVRPVTESRTPYVTELRKESQERMIMTLCSSSSFDTGLVTICVHTYQMLCANWLDRNRFMMRNVVSPPSSPCRSRMSRVQQFWHGVNTAVDPLNECRLCFDGPMPPTLQSTPQINHPQSMDPPPRH